MLEKYVLKAFSTSTGLTISRSFMGLIDMSLINLNTEIVACILSFRNSRHKPNLENTSKYGFFWGKNGGVLSMRMQVILNSSFARPGSAPIWGGKKGEIRDWTNSSVGRASNQDLEGHGFDSRWGLRKFFF